MKIETKFDLGQEVFLLRNHNKAVYISSIKLTGKNIIYQVEFWTDDGIKSAEVYEDEICAHLSDALGYGVGFKKEEPTTGKNPDGPILTKYGV